MVVVVQFGEEYFCPFCFSCGSVEVDSAVVREGISEGGHRERAARVGFLRGVQRFIDGVHFGCCCGDVDDGSTGVVDVVGDVGRHSLELDLGECFE